MSYKSNARRVRFCARAFARNTHKAKRKLRSAASRNEVRYQEFPVAHTPICSEEFTSKWKRLRAPVRSLSDSFEPLEISLQNGNAGRMVTLSIDS
jgi:hypothetical protein